MLDRHFVDFSQAKDNTSIRQNDTDDNGFEHLRWQGGLLALNFIVPSYGKEQ